MMNFFKALMRAIFSRYTLALLALVVGGLVIWFLGPLLSFGGLQPLQTVGMRVTVSVLLLALLLCLLLRWSMLVIGVAVACLLIWHAGPLLALGNTTPFSPVWVRVVFIALILLIYAVYGLYRLFRALQADEDLLKRWLHPEQRKAEANLAKEEIKSLTRIVRQAVDQLRQMRISHAPGLGATPLRRLLEGKRYLYELPWYMIVGVPGSGKTTALLNSGCKFPIANQMGSASAQIALSSSAGTVNTNWWFTNEAVLIDTAGRYTQQNDGAKVLAPVAADGASGDSVFSAQDKNAAEWIGYLGLLRKYRPRAPINGALITLSMADLVNQSEALRMAQAAALRARLAELRRELGVRFPVYVIVTKADLLKGFSDYFSALTTEGRSQVWGLTLPWQENGPAANAVARASGKPETAHDASTPGVAVQQELKALQQRLEDGLPARLQEEFDLDRRQRLYALPQELGGIIAALTKTIDDIFLDSRFDTTELTHSLRGVYFTSAQQTSASVVAEPNTLIGRLMRVVQSAGQRGEHGVVTGNRSFFIHDVLSRLVFREAHLVRPNLGWEFRFRMARWLGHALALGAFLWLAAALVLSYQNNRTYLADVGRKTEALGTQVSKLFAKFRIDEVPATLTLAEELPSHTGLDLNDPPLSYRYGLYTAPPILDATADTYAHLQDQMLLPQIVRRMENALSQAIVDRDEKRAFETLRVYLMLHDKAHYNAQAVKDWVLRDWQGADGTRLLGTQAALLSHIESEFSGDRVVQSPLVKNEGLVKRARSFLDGSTSTARLYERTRDAMAQDGPPDFNLLRVVGPQAGTVFTRLSGKPLELGVPGLYTYDGYHELFSRRLPELIAKGEQEDAWVMGNAGGIAGSNLGPAQKKTLDEAARLLKITPLMEDVRRQYLTEYAQHWNEFLSDIAPVTGTTLAYNLNVVRQFAAPDSPLARLARAAVRETTLSRSLEVVSEADKSYFDKASEQLSQQATKFTKNLGLRPESRLERQLVDNQFAALREVVTGQSENTAYAGGGLSPSLSGGLRSGLDSAVRNAATSPSSSQGNRPAMEGITALVNDFYTVLAVADTAIATNSLPAAGADAGARLRMEAARLPAPFKEVLTRLAVSGAEKVTQGAANILRVQAQSQLDRLLGLMAVQVSEPCKRAIEGRYPFMAAGSNAQEVAADDFNAFFAAGGAADEYFTKYLSPFVDTSFRPWRYKSPSMGNMMVGIEAAGNAATPATTGPTLTGELLKLLAEQGPNPEGFARIAQIREVFFREAGSKKMAFKMDVKVLQVDPSIVELVINLDGQGQRYVHGPVQAIPITWPGPRGGSIAELTATPRVRPDTSTISTTGPWALMRLVERGRVIDGAALGRSSVEFTFDGRRAVLDINTGRLPSPLTTDLLRTFRCPGRA